MKTKLKFLIKQSLKKKTDTKWFKVANILILVLLIGVVNVDRIISFFGGDFENTTKVYVMDEANSYDLLKANFDALTSSLEDLGNYELEKSDKSLEELKSEIEEKDDIILNIKKSDTNYIEANITSFDPLGTITEQLLQMSLNNVKSAYVLETSGMSEEEIAALTSNVVLSKNVTNPDLDENAEGNDLVSSGLIIVLIVPFFLLITMLTQMIGAEINDEKSTRGMEIIISNVSPKTHFLSKIISSTLFVILQALILVADAVIALVIRKLLSVAASGGVSTEVAGFLSETLETIKNTGVLSLLAKGAPFIILLFLFSFLAYAIVAGVLASMTTNIEDYQQLQTPLMIILMVGYYIAIMASTFEGALFVKIVAYIPMLSFLISPVIYLLGQISLLELILSTAICGGATYLLFHFGLRIYKVGILNYSSQDLWKKIFKSMKEK